MDYAFNAYILKPHLIVCQVLTCIFNTLNQSGHFNILFKHFYNMIVSFAFGLSKMGRFVSSNPRIIKYSEYFSFLINFDYSHKSLWTQSFDYEDGAIPLTLFYIISFSITYFLVKFSLSTVSANIYNLCFTNIKYLSLIFKKLSS